MTSGPNPAPTPAPTPDSSPATSPAPASARVVALASALTRYRALAYATGGFLLLLTLHVVLQVAQREPGRPLFEAEGIGAVLPGGGAWVPAVHGWLYLVYVVVSVDLWFRTRLNFPRMVGVVLAGTVPFMSFVAERWVRGQVRPMIERASVGSANA